MDDKTLERKKSDLVEDIDNSKKEYEDKKKKNEVVYYSLIGQGIIFSAGATIFGLLDLGIIASIMALIVAISVSIESSIKFGEKGSFYRILTCECKNLKLALKYRVNNEKNFQLIVDKFQTVVETSAKSLPRGQGMQSVKTLYEDLDRNGILIVPEAESRAKKKLASRISAAIRKHLKNK
jgi:hypothetical protein